MFSNSTSITYHRHFGARYLYIDNFCDFCQHVGLHRCDTSELERYERDSLMYPAARLVMPEDYAQSFWAYQHGLSSTFHYDAIHESYHQLEHILRYPKPRIDTDTTDFRHPIDKAWGQFDSIYHPKEHQYQPWSSYDLSIPGATRARHFYHYWQIHEVYEARKRSGMYRDNTTTYPDTLEFGSIRALAPSLNALSYFQWLYQEHLHQTVLSSQSNADGMVLFDSQQKQKIEEAARQYAEKVLNTHSLDEIALYSTLKGMLFLHHRYEQSERYRLAEALKRDIWRMVEFIGFGFSISSDEISNRVGFVGPGTSNQNSLDTLFPNQRKIRRDKAEKILISYMQQYNQRVATFPVTSQDIKELLDFIEITDLAPLEYILANIDITHFQRTSWYETEAFLNLKALASFPESFLYVLIDNSPDKCKIANQGRGLYNLIKILLCTNHREVWRKYESEVRSRSAQTLQDFKDKVQRLTSSIYDNSNKEDVFLGSTLALATLLRNFTSHHLTETPQILTGHYVHCITSIINTSFLIWSEAKKRGWR